MSLISLALRQQLAAQARYRCGYCHTQEAVSGVPLTVEHILPRAKGGSDDEDNLWLSCRLCNEAKGVQTHAIDPASAELAPLFNPRQQIWSEHFAWSDNGVEVIGCSPAGRATVVALSLNTEFRRRARELWVEVGWHPPAD